MEKTEKLKIGVGTEESIKMEAKPVKVVSLDVTEKTFGDKTTDQLIVMVKHPNKEMPFQLYNVSYQKGSAIKAVGFSLYYDSTGKILKGTGPAEILRIYNLASLQDMVGKEFPTVMSPKGWLSLKAY